MALTDLATLPYDLSQFPPEQLLSYLRVRIPWLSGLNNLAIDDVVSEICNSVLDLHSEETRLGRVAELYSWLLPRNILTSWQIYGLNATAGLVMDCPTLLEHIAAALRFPHYGVRLAWNKQEGVFYAALVTEDYASWPSKNTVVCVALWCGLPLLAVHAVGASIERRFQVALNTALISAPALPLDGIYEDLNGAFCAGSRLLAYLYQRLNDKTQRVDAPPARPLDIARAPRHEKFDHCGNATPICGDTSGTYFTQKELKAHQQKMPTGKKPCCFCQLDEIRRCAIKGLEKADDGLKPLDCRVNIEDSNEVTLSSDCSGRPPSATCHENGHFGFPAKQSTGPTLHETLSIEASMDFLCLVCGMAFTKRTALKEHFKVHLEHKDMLSVPLRCVNRLKKRGRKR